MLYALPSLGWFQLWRAERTTDLTAAALVASHVAIAIAAFLYHLSEEREYARIDRALARAAMVANACVCRYDTACGLAAVAVGGASLLVFFTQEEDGGEGVKGGGGEGDRESSSPPRERGSERRRKCESRGERERERERGRDELAKATRTRARAPTHRGTPRARSAPPNNETDAWHHSLWHVLGCAVGVLVAMSRR